MGKILVFLFSQKFDFSSKKSMVWYRWFVAALSFKTICRIGTGTISLLDADAAKSGLSEALTQR